MGQRANLVILRDGDWQLYYDHWCANRIDTDLFWGPEHAEAFITQRKAQDKSAWLDEVWFEGGAIMDFDRRRLMLSGGEEILYEIPLRWATLALMREVWQGWRITYATQGIVDIADYLDVPRSLVLVDRGPSDYSRFTNPNHTTADDNLLLTFRRNGRSGARRLFGHPEALRFGPDHLVPLVVADDVDALDWGSNRLLGGIHLDIDQKRLSSWWAAPFPAAIERQMEAWPGWRIDWLGDDFRRHAEVSGLDFRYSEPDWLGLQKGIIASLRQRAVYEARNPALESMAAIRSEGVEEVSISPWTSHTRGSVIMPAEKTSILDRLEARLPVPVTGP